MCCDLMMTNICSLWNTCFRLYLMAIKINSQVNQLSCISISIQPLNDNAWTFFTWKGHFHTHTVITLSLEPPGQCSIEILFLMLSHHHNMPLFQNEMKVFLIERLCKSYAINTHTHIRFYYFVQFLWIIKFSFSISMFSFKVFQLSGANI